MRTTISVEDRLLERARREARKRHVSLGQLVEEALRRELSVEATRKQRPEVPVFTRGTGLHPGVDATSLRALLETMENGLPVEQRR